MYNEENDYELLYLISEKNEEAYNKIYCKYNKLIKRIAIKVYNNSKYLGCSLDDIYEAGLIGFFSAINNFDENEGVLFYTYAMSFVNNEIISFIRDYNRNKHAILTDSISLNQEFEDSGKAIGDFIIDKQDNVYDYYNIEALKRFVDLKYDLPFFHSLVYELKINNFTNGEIVELLNVKYKKLDNIIRNIKDKLKKRINIIEVF